MRIPQLAIAVLVLFVFSSCVGKKKFLELQSQQTALQVALEDTKLKLDGCEDEKAALETKLKDAENDSKLKDEKIALREQQIETLEKTNTNLFTTQNATALYSLSKYFGVRRLRREVKQFCLRDA